MHERSPFELNNPRCHIVIQIASVLLRVRLRCPLHIDMTFQRTKHPHFSFLALSCCTATAAIYKAAAAMGHNAQKSTQVSGKHDAYHPLVQKLHTRARWAHSVSEQALTDALLSCALAKMQKLIQGT